VAAQVAVSISLVVLPTSTTPGFGHSSRSLGVPRIFILVIGMA
jgi:hypothetical protein